MVPFCFSFHHFQVISDVPATVWLFKTLCMLHRHVHNFQLKYTLFTQTTYMERQSSLAYWFVVITGPFFSKLNWVCSSSTWYGWVRATFRFQLAIQSPCKRCAEIVPHVPKIFKFYCLHTKREEMRSFTLFKITWN